MSIKLNIGINRKVGEPNYGSRGASCNVEFELDGSFDNGGAARFQEAARKAYAACRQAVEDELSAGNGSPHHTSGGQHVAPTPDNGHHTTANAARNGIRMATGSQVRAIHAIAGRSRVDLTDLLQSQFGVGRPDDLSIVDASTLIDQLKGAGTGNAGNGARR